MKLNLTTVARIVLGLIFFVFGLNGFLQFMPAPPPMPEKAMAYMGGLMQSGYFFPVLKGTEVLMGLLLLTGRFVPLALVVLSPIVIHITLFHTMLTPFNPVVAILLACQIYLGYSYRDKFRPLFS